MRQHTILEDALYIISSSFMYSTLDISRHRCVDYSGGIQHVINVSHNSHVLTLDGNLTSPRDSRSFIMFNSNQKGY